MTVPSAVRPLTVAEFHRRERLLSRGLPLATALLAIGTILTTIVWTLATSRRATLDALGRAATPAEIDEATRASSLEAELLLLAAGSLWLGVIVAIASAHLLARLRSRAAQRR